MVGQILTKRFWAVVAAPAERNGAVHIILLQADTDPDLQDLIISHQEHFRGMEILSDYTQIAIN